MKRLNPLSEESRAERLRLNRYKNRVAQRKKPVREPQIGFCTEPSFFVEGRLYTSISMCGHDPAMRYTCVYVSQTLVAFSFEFQGVERIATVYHNDIKQGDWVLAVGKPTNE